MMQFRVHFHRYVAGDSRLSNPHWVSAEDFTEAVRIAGHMLIALRGADPVSRYEVASVEAHGLIAKECNGALMFETAEELFERCGHEGRNKGA